MTVSGDFYQCTTIRESYANKVQSLHFCLVKISSLFDGEVAGDSLSTVLTSVFLRKTVIFVRMVCDVFKVLEEEL